MAKVIIPLAQLPPPNRDGTHLVRFRIATDDGSSISDWSKLFRVESVGQKSNGLVAADLTVLKAGGPYEVKWTPYIETIASVSGSANINVYDIFVDENDGNGLKFYSRVNTNSVIVYSNTTTKIRVYGQLPTHPTPPITSTGLKELFGVFDTGLIDL